MRIEKITYEDFNEVERTEEFHFHVSKAYLMKLNDSKTGGYAGYLQKLVDAKEQSKLEELIEKMIREAYCVPTESGKSVERSEALSNDFINSPAYDILLERLLSDAKYAADFFTEILPKDFAKGVREEIAKNPDVLKIPQ